MDTDLDRDAHDTREPKIEDEKKNRPKFLAELDAKKVFIALSLTLLGILLWILILGMIGGAQVDGSAADSVELQGLKAKISEAAKALDIKATDPTGAIDHILAQNRDKSAKLAAAETKALASETALLELGKLAEEVKLPSNNPPDLIVKAVKEELGKLRLRNAELQKAVDTAALQTDTPNATATVIQTPQPQAGGAVTLPPVERGSPPAIAKQGEKTWGGVPQDDLKKFIEENNRRGRRPRIEERTEFKPLISRATGQPYRADSPPARTPPEGWKWERRQADGVWGITRVVEKYD